MRSSLLFLGLVAACGDPSGSSQSGVDAAHQGGDGGDPGPCEKPFLGAQGLGSSLHDWVGTLSHERSTVGGRNLARTFLSEQLTALGLTPMAHDYAGGSNVYAIIPSTTGSTEQIILGAHFDSVAGSPGANDNASGSAIVLAVARFLKATNCRGPNVTVIFFDQEEDGLFGSRAYATKLVTDQTVVRAVHTVDQVGWDEDLDRVFEIEQPTSALGAEYTAAADTLGLTISLVQSGGTDHESFRDMGFKAVGVTEEYAAGDTSPFRHTPQDTADTIDEGFLVLGTKLVARVLIDETFVP